MACWICWELAPENKHCQNNFSSPITLLPAETVAHSLKAWSWLQTTWEYWPRMITCARPKSFLPFCSLWNLCVTFKGPNDGKRNNILSKRTLSQSDLHKKVNDSLSSLFLVLQCTIVEQLPTPWSSEGHRYLCTSPVLSLLPVLSLSLLQHKEWKGLDRDILQFLNICSTVILADPCSRW